jgi:hypothetical protein
MSLPQQAPWPDLFRSPFDNPFGGPFDRPPSLQPAGVGPHGPGLFDGAGCNAPGCDLPLPYIDYLPPFSDPMPRGPLLPPGDPTNIWWDPPPPRDPSPPVPPPAVPDNYVLPLGIQPGQRLVLGIPIRPPIPPPGSPPAVQPLVGLAPTNAPPAPASGRGPTLNDLTPPAGAAPARPGALLREPRGMPIKTGPGTYCWCACSPSPQALSRVPGYQAPARGICGNGLPSQVARRAVGDASIKVPTE